MTPARGAVPGPGPKNKPVRNVMVPGFDQEAGLFFFFLPLSDLSGDGADYSVPLWGVPRGGFPAKRGEAELSHSGRH